MRSRAVLALLLALAAAGVALAATTEKITNKGVGAVKLGATYTTLHHRNLIGRIQHGCELGGPNTRSASLRKPLKGTVNFTTTPPRKVTDISVSAGAKARGVGIGATISGIKAVFPKAKVDHSTDSTFEVTLVTVPKSEGGKIAFAVSTKTHRVTLIGIPFVAVCD